MALLAMIGDMEERFSLHIHLAPPPRASKHQWMREQRWAPALLRHPRPLPTRLITTALMTSADTLWSPAEELTRTEAPASITCARHAISAPYDLIFVYNSSERPTHLLPNVCSSSVSRSQHRSVSIRRWSRKMKKSKFPSKLVMGGWVSLHACNDHFTAVDFSRQIVWQSTDCPGNLLILRQITQLPKQSDFSTGLPGLISWQITRMIFDNNSYRYYW